MGHENPTVSLFHRVYRGSIVNELLAVKPVVIIFSIKSKTVIAIFEVITIPINEERAKHNVLIHLTIIKSPGCERIKIIVILLNEVSVKRDVLIHPMVVKSARLYMNLQLISTEIADPLHCALAKPRIFCLMAL